MGFWTVGLLRIPKKCEGECNGCEVRCKGGCNGGCESGVRRGSFISHPPSHHASCPLRTLLARKDVSQQCQNLQRDNDEYTFNFTLHLILHNNLKSFSTPKVMLTVQINVIIRYLY